MREIMKAKRKLIVQLSLLIVIGATLFAGCACTAIKSASTQPVLVATDLNDLYAAQLDAIVLANKAGKLSNAALLKLEPYESAADAAINAYDSAAQNGDNSASALEQAAETAVANLAAQYLAAKGT